MTQYYKEQDLPKEASSQPIQPVQQVEMTRGNITMEQIQPYTWSHKGAQPGQPVVTGSTTTHQILQTQETDPHALNVENKVT